MGTFKDLTGIKFNFLTVLRLSEQRGYKNSYFWHCRCECGNLADVAASTLANGHTKSCGCYRPPLLAPKQDITGNCYGNITVLARVGKGGKWTCQCKCGSVFATRATSLLSGATKSCGCLRKEKMSGSNSIFWGGGHTKERRRDPSLMIWARQVKRRDKFSCLKCFITSRKPGALHAHHIQTYCSHIDLANELSNGATLCAECHKKFHNIYGRLDNNLEQLTEYIGTT